jgi:membrane-associated phospholipid phosphatase
VIVARQPWWATTRSALTWMLLATAGCLGLIAAVYLVFVRTTRGQWVDDAALRGTAIGRQHIIQPVSNILNLVSATALVLATATVAVLAYLRRRPRLAMLAVLLVAGSTLTTEVVKHLVLTRPLHDPVDPLPFNTLPSGHTTVALSVAAAVTLVVPARLRVPVAVVGVLYGGATGVATLSAGWHRPSDAVAACLVVGAWVGVVGALAVAMRHRGEPRDDGWSYPLARGAAALSSLGLLAVAALALAETARSVTAAPSRPRLFLAYAGGACAIAGTALAAMGWLLVVTQRARTDELDRG